MKIRFFIGGRQAQQGVVFFFFLSLPQNKEIILFLCYGVREGQVRLLFSTRETFCPPLMRELSPSAEVTLDVGYTCDFFPGASPGIIFLFPVELPFVNATVTMVKERAWKRPPKWWHCACVIAWESRVLPFHLQCGDNGWSFRYHWLPPILELQGSAEQMETGVTPAAELTRGLCPQHTGPSQPKWRPGSVFLAPAYL